MTDRLAATAHFNGADIPMRPRGPMNMLATECSMPMHTKAEMGNQMPTFRAKGSVAWHLITAADQ